MDEITIKTNSTQTTSTQAQTAATSGTTADPTIEADSPAGLTPQTLDQKYPVPLLVKQKYPELPTLIMQTESMSEEEREYWFQIMPIMAEDQLDKLKTILISEKDQLAQLDKEYEEELNRLNEKHMLEWKEFESKEKRQALKAKESEAEKTEKQLEEDLLAKLNAL